VGMNLFANKQPVILLQETPMLLHAAKALAPLIVADADCREAKPFGVIGLINVEASN
jgi:hypothetical protein